MARQLLISKPTIAIIKSALVAIHTHSSMRNAFEQYGFEEHIGTSISNKLDRAGAHLDQQDWADPAIVKQLLGLLEQRFAEMLAFAADAVEKNEACQRILKALRDREGYEWDGLRFVPGGATALVHAAETAAEFDLDSLQNELRRIFASVETDPDDAITAAKCLIEATCREILNDFGEQPDNGIELGPLTKQTLKHLQLLPEQVDNASKGADAAKKVLHSLGTSIQGLGELRNLYGDAHGKKPGTKGVKPRHARLAATFSGALATFLLETHQQRKES